MVPEATLERTENGASPSGDGWFVLNAHDARWFESDGLDFYTSFEAENARFPQIGFGLGILRSGEPSAMYHGEDAQEDFLVLAGECLLSIEGEERLLRAWDFVRCPPWTEHIFVGAGDGPCLVLGVGARRKGSRHPLSPQRAGTQVRRRRREADLRSQGGLRALRRRQAHPVPGRFPPNDRRARDNRTSLRRGCGRRGTCAWSLPVAAGHFRDGKVPRGAAHAWAARGHMLKAQACLDEQAREHSDRSSLPDG